MSPLKAEHLPHYTYADYAQWEGRWELIHGVAFAMAPAPSPRHQMVSQKIAAELERCLSTCPQCHALLPVDWRIADDIVVQPDNLVICHEPEGPYLTQSPHLIFEVLSPSTALKDRNIKYELYEKAGVLYYCLIDTQKNQATIYKLVNGRYVKEATVSKEYFDFDWEGCRLSFNFSTIWVEAAIETQRDRLATRACEAREQYAAGQCTTGGLREMMEDLERV